MSTWQPLVEQLVHERGSRLVAYAAMLVGRDEDAEDLVHDALVKVFSRHRSFASVGHADAYVRRTMPSIVIDRARSRKSRSNATDKAFQRPPAATDLDAGIDVRRALRQLPPREQVCVVMRFFDDLTVPEIARRLGLAEGTVKRYLSNATSRMAELLDASGDWEQHNETIDIVAMNGAK